MSAALSNRLPVRQRGFGLIAAVFLIALALLVVLAAALALSARSRSTVQALDASRALFAAQSGLEVAIARSLGAGAGSGCAAVPGTLTIEGFNVVLTCTATVVDEAPQNYSIFALEAHASRGSFASGTFISRRARATVTQ